MRKPKTSKKETPAPVKKDDQQLRFKRSRDLVDFAFKIAQGRAIDAEGILISLHTVKADEKGQKTLISSFHYTDFPNGDFGTAMIAFGVEARNAKLQAITGQSKAA